MATHSSTLAWKISWMEEHGRLQSMGLQKVGHDWATSLYYVLGCVLTHSSTLAWQIPWTEEPGGLQSMGLLGVRHDWATSLSLSCIGEGNGNPLECSCLENPRDGGAWWAAICGVAQSRTRLKQLSSSSSSRLCTVFYACYFFVTTHHRLNDISLILQSFTSFVKK